MKITIDTKEDSHEDIRKVLHILTHTLGQKAPVDIQQNEPIDTTIMMNMFSNGSEQQNIPEKAPDFTSFLNLTKKNDDTKDAIEKIEFF
ncbi:hypothetical protein COV17_04285 [Candidatus Woesearchaeota archaeon CG10_big_fil_rev_8_21_14_0_10_36_11]|nr:MAG: hypothetical protein COV17_04285 [Candidatus Woesearchaeota archaeon CG10_big_fil_rev_8_21_14_0_10_36_11]